MLGISRIKHRLAALKMNKRLSSLSKDVQRKRERPKAPWKIEILIPTYNHAKYLERTWQSAYTQDYADSFTITVIDDCSSDDTQKVIRSLKQMAAKKKIRTKFVKNTSNLRQHGSLNRAIAASGADILVILNDDDLLTPDALTFITRAFMENEKVYLVGSTSVWFTEDADVDSLIANRQGQQKLTIARPKDVKNYMELNDLNMTHTSMAFFKCAWESVEGYSAKEQRIHPLANEDRDFQMRVNALYSVGVYEDYPLALWRTDSSHGKDF